MTPRSFAPLCLAVVGTDYRSDPKSPWVIPYQIRAVSPQQIISHYPHHVQAGRRHASDITIKRF